MLPCVRSGSSLQHGQDASTARCRVSASLLRTHRANIGWVLHFRVTIPTHSATHSLTNSDSDSDSDGDSGSDRGTDDFEVLCTAWPQQSGVSEEESAVVFLDDAVTKGQKVFWQEAQCRVLRAYPPNPCHNVRCQVPSMTSLVNEKNNGLVPSIFGGFPVSNGFQVTAKPIVSIKSAVQSFSVTGLPPGQYGVIDVMTLLMAVGGESTGTVSKSSTNDTVSHPRASCTGVVHTIIRNCLFPSVLYPTRQLYTSGILLTGPPGVGKTYAITAVKEICKDICNIKIHNICIPDILSHSDPLNFVENILKSSKSAPLPVTQQKIVSTSGSRFSAAASYKSTPTVLKTPGKSATTPSRGARTPSSTSTISSPPPSGQGFSWLTPSPQKQPSSTIAQSSPFRSSSSNPNNSFASNGRTPRSQTGKTHLTASDEFLSVSRVCDVHVIMLDEVDALGGTSEVNATNELQHSIKHIICNWMDKQAQTQIQCATSGTAYSPCIIIATSNRPSDVDNCFCRGGRLEKVIDISESSVVDRDRILRSLLSTGLSAILGVKSSDGDRGLALVDMIEPLVASLSKDIALSTGGYVAADLSSLVSEIVQICRCTSIHHLPRTPSKDFGEDYSNQVNSFLDKLRNMVMSTTQIAKKTVAPSCLRGATVELPDLTYDDVIGYSEVKKNLSRVLSFSSVASREKLIQFGQNTMLGGVLLYGPPGNSKTRLVQAAAATYGLPMISLSSADVYSAYVGDSEAEIRRVFNLARQSHPCVLFMDEIDALVTNRQEESSSNNVESRVLSTLLNEMDGIDGGGNGVFVIAATNRIDFIDSALLRKGRFHHLLHVPLPDLDEKILLLQYFAKRFGIDSQSISEITPKLTNDQISGADVENLCREAGMTKIRNFISTKIDTSAAATLSV